MADEGEMAQQADGGDSAAASSEKWGDGIAANRQAWLESKLQAWEADHGAKRGPFVGEQLTGADVYWLAARSLVGSIDETAIAAAREALRKGFLGGAARGMPKLHLEGAFLVEAHLESAFLLSAHLEGAFLGEAHLEGAVLGWAHLEGAVLSWAHLEGAELGEAHLEGAHLEQAYLGGAKLGWAHLEGARLDGAYLEGAELGEAHLEGARLDGAYLVGADLTSATFDKASRLNGAVLAGASLDQVTYDGVNLTVVDWSLVPALGDELTARESKDKDGKRKDRARRIDEYTAAVRAYRMLAVTLRGQGMNEDADRYAYRAQILQRDLLCLEGRTWKWVLWCFLEGLAGFGYRPEYTLGWYVAVLILSTIVYCWQGAIFAHPNTPALTILGSSIVDAFTALHGRGFFPTPAESGWQMGTAAFDAVAGMIIEASFIATFTQRFFAH